MSPPDLRELLDDDVPADEVARLERVHALLVAAGPPPELSPALHAPAVAGGPPDPETAADTAWLPRRRRATLIALAACLAAATFGAGYLYGQRAAFTTVDTVTMYATAKAPRGALATIAVGKTDAAGNTRLRLHVRGLAPSEGRSYYELFLTRKGRTTYSCGSLRARAGSTTVDMTVPYPIKPDSTWVLVNERVGKPPHEVVLRTARI